jgi:putative ABC transport system substrate-binding protein
MALDGMKRREVVALLGGAAASWPFVASAAQEATPAIGYLHFAFPGPFAYQVAAFRQGLGTIGYVEGQNIAIEYRWAEGTIGRLPALAADLVRRKVAVIVAMGPPAASAAKAATTTIPIVFAVGTDPVETGLVASLSHPGGDLTGVSLLAVDLTAKRLELLSALVPHARVIALLVNPANTNSWISDVQKAARVTGVDLPILKAATAGEIDAAFAGLGRLHADALVIGDDVYFTSRREQLVALASRYAIPTIERWREFAAAGGLISYGPDLAEVSRQAGIYAGRILKGERPADLPVEQPTKFELVINLKTAKALGLTVPPLLLARADEIID